MSFDLFQREANEAVARMPAVMEPEPGITENFFKGVGMYAMRSAAMTARGIDTLGAIPAILEDKMEAFRTGRTAQGVTTMQDKYFKEHDEVWNSAVDYWTPKPNEVGMAGEVVGQLVGMLPQIIAFPSVSVGAHLMGTAEDLVRKGVPADKAAAAGAVQAAGLGLGIWMPILGQNLWQRVALGGAGFNVAQGIGARAGTQAILGDHPAAREFDAFDGKALTLDLLLGMAFGGVAHISPAMRAQGKEVWSRVESWARDLPPSDKDAIAVLRVAEHLNKDSLPGTPAGPEAIDVHVQKIRAAVEQLVTDKPVEVSDVDARVQPGVTHEELFRPDPVREEVAAEQMKVLTEAAEKVVREQRELGALWDFSRSAPLAAPDSMIVRLEPEHLDAILVEHGPALLKDGEVRVTGKELKKIFGSERGYGAVKIIYRHGPESSKPIENQVVRQDLIDFPEVVRRFEPIPDKDGNIPSNDAKSMEWVVEKEDGRRVLYGVSTFKRDGKPHSTTIHVLGDAANKPLSGPRNEDAQNLGQSLGGRPTPDTAAPRISTDDSALSAGRGLGAAESIETTGGVVQRTEGPAAKREDLSPPPRGDASAEAAGLEAQVIAEVNAKLREARGEEDGADAAEKSTQSEKLILSLDEADTRAELEMMAFETGWAEVGGRLIRQKHSEVSGDETISRTKWIPNAEWWPGRPKGLTEAQTKAAIAKALAGEPLKAAEKRLIDYMLDEAAERVIGPARQLEEAERAAVANELTAEGLEPTARNVVDHSLVVRAIEISEDAVENAAVRFQNDDSAFMAEIRRIIREHQNAETTRSGEENSGQAQSRTAAAGESQAQGLNPEAGPAAAHDALRAAADDVAANSPDLKIIVGQGADGTLIEVPVSEYLATAREQAKALREDVQLVEAAATCLFGGGA